MLEKHHRHTVRLKGYDYAQKQTCGEIIWQRNYYEHVMRDENDYNRV
ncbi:hypothetical protein [Cysteiniphilum halobium]|nr:hypothetical protein [Cysteiniphilum halobium]